MRTVLAAGAAVLALGLVFLAGGQAADEKGPRDEVDKLTELGVKDPGALHKKAAEYAKSLEGLDDVMGLMKRA